MQKFITCKEIRNISKSRIINKPSKKIFSDNLRKWPASSYPEALRGKHLVAIISRVRPDAYVTSADTKPTAEKSLSRYHDLMGQKEKTTKYCLICKSENVRMRRAPFACRDCRHKLREAWCEVRCEVCETNFIKRFCAHVYKLKTGDACLCSRACAGKKQTSNGKVIPKCKICGKDCKSIQNKFCSSACMGVANRKHFGKLEACAFCGETFRQGKWRVRCCGDRCADLLKKSASLISDVRYAPRERIFSYSGSAKAMMILVRKRDKRACAICSSSGKTKYVQVHHIDTVKENNSPGNLINLCKVCHTNAHHRPDMEQYHPGPLRKIAILNTKNAPSSLQKQILDLQLDMATIALREAKINLENIKRLTTEGIER